MNDFDDIKQLWVQTNVEALPTADELIKTVKRFRLKQICKSVGFIVFTLLLAAVMVWVVVSYKSNLVSTRIGEGLFFTAMLIIIIVSTLILRRSTIHRNCTNLEFLQYLKEEHQRLISYHKRIQVIGFVFASLGLYLYMFELVYKRPAVLVTTYIALTIWVAFSWLVIRPIAFMKKTKQLRDTIEKVERLSRQLSGN